MLPDLLQRLSGEWIDPLRRAGISLQPPLSALKMITDRDNGARAKLLIFSAGQSEPSVALKWARSPDAQMRLTHEFQALGDIWSITALQSTVPRALGRFQVGDDLVMLESCLPGTPLSVLLGRHERINADQVQHDLFRAQVWIQVLQTSTALGTIRFPGRSAIEQRLELLYRAGLHRDELPRIFIDRLCEEADNYQELRLPLAGRHGNFRPSTFILDTNQVGVIDWEHFTRGATPTDDIFHFAIGLTQAYPRIRPHGSAAQEAFCEAFVESNWFSNLIGEYVNRYLRAMHLPEEAAYLLFSLFLIDMATLESQRSQPSDDGQKLRWLPLLITYTQNERHSIFGSRTQMIPAASLPSPAQPQVESMSTHG